MNSKRQLAILAAGLLLALSGKAAVISWTNTAGGNWNISSSWSPNVVPAAGDSVRITNAGTYTVTFSSGGFVFNDLVCGGGAGTQTLAASTVFRFANGATIQTNGILRLAGGQLNLTNSMVVNGQIELLTSGTIRGDHNITVNGRMLIDGGTVQSTGNISVPGRLDLNGGTLALTGTVAIAASGKLGIDGGLAFNNGSILHSGSGLWSSGSIACGSPGVVFSNLPGATLVITNTADFNKHVSATVNQFQNRGTLQIDAPTGLVAAIDFDHDGVVDIISGTLRNRGGNFRAPVNIAADGSLEFQTRTNLFAPGVAVAGPGTIRMTSGTWEIDPGLDLAVSNLVFSAGNIRGGTRLTVAGATTWSGGVLTNLTFVSGGTMTLLGSGSAGRSLNNAILDNAGQLQFLANGMNTLVGATSLITNRAGAVLLGTNSSTIAGDGPGVLFVNHGTVRKVGTGDFTLERTVHNHGAIELLAGRLVASGGSTAERFIQFGGSTLLSNATLLANNSVDLRGGELIGAGSVTGPVTNNGIVRPGVPLGRLSFSGNYVQTPAGELAIELGGTAGGTNYDQLTVTGNARLDGKVSVSLLDGFVPASTNIFSFLTFTTRSNSFATLEPAFTTPPVSLNYTNTAARFIVTDLAWQLAPIGTQQVVESTPFAITIGTVAPLPPNQDLTFTLLAGPTNAVLNTNTGAFTWTPTEAQGPGSFDVIIRARDNLSPPIVQTQQFTIVVLESNLPPALAAISNRSIAEGSTLSVQLAGADPDLPPNNLSYSASGAPGLQINSSGLLTWTPEEEQGPGTYSVTVTVNDNGQPNKSASRTFSISVTEVNSPPVLLDPGEQLALEGELLELQLDATDEDLPEQNLTFSRLSGPTGSSISSAGVFSWTPTAAFAGTTNEVRARVADNGIPSMSATQTFRVAVISVAPALTITSVPPNVLLTWPTSPSGFHLQSTPSLSPIPTWTDVSSVPLNLGDLFQLNLPPNADQKFFRLLRAGTTNQPPPVVASLLRGPYLQVATPASIKVRFRTNRSVKGRVAYGLTTNLTQFVDGPAATEHVITLANLQPGTRYYYSVGSDTAPIALGADYTFRTAPLGEAPTRIWVIGDAGSATTNQAAVRNAYYNYATNEQTDVWLMLGDNAYQTGTDAEYQSAVFNMYPTLLRRTPLWPAIGNHETAQSHTPATTTPYLRIFSMPTTGEAGGVASGTQRYYSFNHGSIHFVCLDSMTSDRSASGTMATWLRTDLEANTNRWLIAYWHHPPYTKGSHDSDNPDGLDYELVEMRENIVPILESFGVDLVLSGHSHCYERSFLLNGHYGYSTTFTPAMALDAGNGAPATPYSKTEAGPTAGAGTVYAVAGSSGQATFGSLNHPAMHISLLNLGSMILDVDGQRLEGRFLRETGQVQDHFVIEKH